jgi:hypothetical protein
MMTDDDFKFDDERFILLIMDRVKGNTISEAEIEEVFWIVCADYKQWMIENGRAWTKISAIFQKTMLPGLKTFITTMLPVEITSSSPSSERMH